MVLARRAHDWTAGRTDRRKSGVRAVDTASLTRSVTSVAFDQFVFDERALTRADGATLLRGAGADGTVLAVAFLPWPDMPVDWAALQSRRAPDLLSLAGDEMEPVGHRNFDERFAVDADDVSLFRRVFRTSLRDWLVDFDDAHGPLVILFEGPEPPAAPTPKRRTGDVPDDVVPDDGDRESPILFVARLVDDDDAAVETLSIATDLAEHVGDAARR